MRGTWPVSYTHLDVYKRQIFLVSFANFSSIGIIAGAIKGLNEEQGNVVSRFGLRVFLEQLQDIDEVRTRDRVAADTNAGRLAETVIGGLLNRCLLYTSRCV